MEGNYHPILLSLTLIFSSLVLGRNNQADGIEQRKNCQKEDGLIAFAQ